jgi:ubiquinone biosynthesis accessory factor UbiK
MAPAGDHSESNKLLASRGVTQFAFPARLRETPALTLSEIGMEAHTALSSRFISPRLPANRGSRGAAQGGAMNDRKSRLNLDELARQLAESVPQNLKMLGQDLERNFKALLQSGLERMELVTREEFDLQRAVLERTRAKLEQMEARLADLEKSFK